MKLLDLTLDTPEANLALEESLLEWAESTGRECLRFWESPDFFVVLGAGSPVNSDVNIAACEARDIPILRRCSGGGTVVQGPGCFNYTLVLDRQSRGDLETIASTNEAVLGRITTALTACGLEHAAMRGYSDLTSDELKFSGNAQRRRKRFILFHGTVLYGFDLDIISECLGSPEKMPEYRQNRAHEGFITNIDVNPDSLKKAIAEQWQAEEPLDDWPADRTAELARTHYCDQTWIRSI